MPAAIPPPSLDRAETELERALDENRHALDRGETPPFGAGAIVVMQRRVQQARREAPAGG